MIAINGAKISVMGVPGKSGAPIPGNSFRVQADFFNNAGQPMLAEGVQFRIRKPNGLQYLVPTDQVHNSGAGRFYFDIVLELAGEWAFYASCTGPFARAVETKTVVVRSEIATPDAIGPALIEDDAVFVTPSGATLTATLVENVAEMSPVGTDRSFFGVERNEDGQLVFRKQSVESFTADIEGQVTETANAVAGAVVNNKQDKTYIPDADTSGPQLSVPQLIVTKLREMYLEAEDFGATSLNGNVDNTPAFQRMVDYYKRRDPTGKYGCIVQLRPGNYYFQSPLPTFRAMRIRGAGMNESGLYPAQNVNWTQPFITISDQAIWLEDFQIEAKSLNWQNGTVPVIEQTNATQLRMLRCSIVSSAATNIRVRGSSALFFDWLRVGNNAAFGDGNVADLISMDVIENSIVRGGLLDASVSYNANDPQLSNGWTLLRIKSARYFNVNHISCRARPKNLIRLSPNTGETIRDVYIDNILSDLSEAEGILIEPTGGTIQKAKFSNANIRGSGGTAGISVRGTGNFGNISFDNPIVTGASGHGIEWRNGFASINNPICAANGGDGIRLGGGASPLTGYTISAGVSGAIGNIAGNSGYGLTFLNGLHGPGSIIGLNAVGNMAGAVNDLVTSTAQRNWSIIGSEKGPGVYLTDSQTFEVFSNGTGATGNIRAKSYVPTFEYYDRSNDERTRTRFNSRSFYIEGDVTNNGEWGYTYLQIPYVANAINYLVIRPSVNNVAVRISAEGPGEQAQLRFESKGLSGIQIGLAGEKIGFGTTPINKPSLTYSRTNESESVSQIRNVLVALGLVTDSTTV